MSINFLSSVSKKEVKKESTQLIFILWNVILFVVLAIISTGLITLDGYFQTQIIYQQATIANTKEEIKQMDDITNKYYTVGYKLKAIEQVKKTNYLPTLVTNYIESKIDEGIKISGYQFFEEGGFEISVSAQDFHTGVAFWNSLLSDKQTVSNLNLQSMARNGAGDNGLVDPSVSFRLTGFVKLDNVAVINE